MNATVLRLKKRNVITPFDTSNLTSNLFFSMDTLSQVILHLDGKSIVKLIASNKKIRKLFLRDYSLIVLLVVKSMAVAKKDSGGSLENLKEYLYNIAGGNIALGEEIDTLECTYELRSFVSYLFGVNFNLDGDITALLNFIKTYHPNISDKLETLIPLSDKILPCQMTSILGFDSGKKYYREMVSIPRDKNDYLTVKPFQLVQGNSERISTRPLSEFYPIVREWVRKAGNILVGEIPVSKLKGWDKLNCFMTFCVSSGLILFAHGPSKFFVLAFSSNQVRIHDYTRSEWTQAIVRWYPDYSSKNPLVMDKFGEFYVIHSLERFFEDQRHPLDVRRIEMDYIEDKKNSTVHGNNAEGLVFYSPPNYMNNNRWEMYFVDHRADKANVSLIHRLGNDCGSGEANVSQIFENVTQARVCSLHHRRNFVELWAASTGANALFGGDGGVDLFAVNGPYMCFPRRLPNGQKIIRVYDIENDKKVPSDPMGDMIFFSIALKRIVPSRVNLNRFFIIFNFAHLYQVVKLLEVDSGSGARITKQWFFECQDIVRILEQGNDILFLEKFDGAYCICEPSRLCDKGAKYSGSIMPITNMQNIQTILNAFQVNKISETLISPDGSIFVVKNRNTCMIYNMKTGSLNDIHLEVTYNERIFTFTPDGKRLVFSTQQEISVYKLPQENNLESWNNSATVIPRQSSLVHYDFTNPALISASNDLVVTCFHASELHIHDFSQRFSRVITIQDSQTFFYIEAHGNRVLYTTRGAATRKVKYTYFYREFDVMGMDNILDLDPLDQPSKASVSYCVFCPYNTQGERFIGIYDQENNVRGRSKKLCVGWTHNTTHQWNVFDAQILDQKYSIHIQWISWVNERIICVFGVGYIALFEIRYADKLLQPLSIIFVKGSTIKSSAICGGYITALSRDLKVFKWDISGLILKANIRAVDNFMGRGQYDEAIELFQRILPECLVKHRPVGHYKHILLGCKNLCQFMDMARICIDIEGNRVDSALQTFHSGVQQCLKLKGGKGKKKRR